MNLEYLDDRDEVVNLATLTFPREMPRHANLLAAHLNYTLTWGFGVNLTLSSLHMTKHDEIHYLSLLWGKKYHNTYPSILSEDSWRIISETEKSNLRQPNMRSKAQNVLEHVNQSVVSGHE